MKRSLICFSLLLTSFISYTQERRTIGYDGILLAGSDKLKNVNGGLIVSILKEKLNGEILYQEIQKINSDSLGNYHIEIGNGGRLQGQFDSIIWSDGVFYLKLDPDSATRQLKVLSHNSLIRIPPDLSRDYEQGTVSSTDHPDYGVWQFRNSRNKRPRLITVDLTTSYANLAYPANTYPVYRHYEWCDEDRNGTGNSFLISYSDNTNNYFRENTNTMGDVRLYAKPFQEVIVSSTNEAITITISKPVPQNNHSETYGIKGPWKFIYYIEW